MTHSALQESLTGEGIRAVTTTRPARPRRARRASRATREPVSDAPDVETAIVLQVTAALVAHPPTELTVIEVDNRQGVVTLTGQVESVQLQAIAGEIASSQPGVEAMVNALEIREPEAGNEVMI